MFTEEQDEKKPVLISELNKKCDARDGDVKFNMMHFTKAFIYHVMFFGITGPLTPLFMLIFERNFILAANMAFCKCDKNTVLIYMIQVITWVCTIVPIIMLLVRSITTGETITETHKYGYDCFLLLTAVLQLIIRAAIISFKYGTLPEKLYKNLHETILTKQEVEGQLLARGDGQFRTNPDGVLDEVAASLTRRSAEPSLITFLPFSDFGPSTRSKFTDIDHYDWKYDSNN